MGDLGVHPPCCAANGFTEGEHDGDCDEHPDNRRRRLQRYVRQYLPAVEEAQAS